MTLKLLLSLVIDLITLLQLIDCSSLPEFQDILLQCGLLCFHDLVCSSFVTVKATRLAHLAAHTSEF
jgi:hypothetical protein